MYSHRTIRCLVVVDTQGLMDDHAGQPSSLTKPILLSPEELEKRVYMVVGSQDTVKGQAIFELDVRGVDTIWWVATSLTAEAVAFADLLQLNVIAATPRYIRGPFRRGAEQWKCNVLSHLLGTLMWSGVLGVGWVGANYAHTPSFYFTWEPAITIPTAPPLSNAS